MPETKQPGCQQFPHGMGLSIPRLPPHVLVDPEQGEAPGAGRGESLDGIQPFEEQAGGKPAVALVA